MKSLARFVVTFSMVSSVCANQSYYVVPAQGSFTVLDVPRTAQFRGISGIRWEDVDKTPGNAKIIICGIQSEPLVLEKTTTRQTLTISGDCPVGARGSIHVNTQTALTIRRNNVDLENLDLSSDAADALDIQSSNVHVVDVVAKNSRNGIRISAIEKIDAVSIQRSQIMNNRLVGIKLNEQRKDKRYSKITIVDNEIVGNGNHGIRIWFRPEASRSSYATNVLIDSNKVTANKGDGIVVVHQSAIDGSPDPLLLDVKIVNNLVQYNTGGIAARGIDSSLRFHSSEISNNTIRYNNGVTGGVNLFWSQGVAIAKNHICCNKTSKVDGNGILIDHGNRGILVTENVIEKNDGSRAKNSGAGVMVLDNEDVLIDGNVIRGNRLGIYLGGRKPSKGISIKNNVISGSLKKDIWLDSHYDVDQVTFEGNTH